MSVNYGVKRVRCVKCNNLTHSGWKLKYGSTEGIHCFKCSSEVRKNYKEVKVKIG